MWAGDRAETAHGPVNSIRHNDDQEENRNRTTRLKVEVEDEEHAGCGGVLPL